MDALAEATEFVHVVEQRQGIQIAALEEIAYQKGWISEKLLRQAAENYGKSAYGMHLQKVLERKILY